MSPVRRWQRDLVIVGLVMGCLVQVGCNHRQDLEQPSPIREHSVRAMRDALREGEKWVKVHAAEFLISLDYRSAIREQFATQRSRYETEPAYRIGIWRVLARLDRHDKTASEVSVNKIVQAFLDETAPDRVHAVESLAKLHYEPTDSVRRALEVFAQDGPDAGRAYAWWVLLNQGDRRAEAALTDALADHDVRLRQTAAYVLRHQAVVSKSTSTALQTALAKEPVESLARPYLLTATYRHADAARYGAQLQSELLELLAQGSASAQYEVTRLAADVGDTWSTELRSLLRESNTSADVKASAAHALCRIGRRHGAHMSRIDWLVVSVYGLGMLSIGVYYVRRTRTSEDYLLGGRTMRPWMVGLSLFATLLSTLSYLAWPGEMIKHGPMIMLGYLSYPLVFLVVGWMLIPRLRQLEVVSAYEILEARFGISIRLLASSLFLSLRLLWMASIIYWTTEIVLMPAAGLDERYTSIVTAALGLVTVIYTSLGGLRAVVLTDVIQTLILFCGAIVTLLLVTSTLGGVSAWYPHEWASHWTEPRIWFDLAPDTRSTLANAMLGSFCWYVCTAGADQMAIQRYLATKDIRAARRSLAISMAAEVSIVVLLGLIGLAVLAFFSAHPDRMADGQTVYANADKLFPRFVVVGLPTGLSGLVIAGLLAAAMSSLSSGVNSSAAVISEDFLNRFTKQSENRREPVMLVRRTSLVVGIVVVVLSSLIGHVQGNMLEVIYKVVNLFTAPLFYLFFMAIFVPKANTPGTWVGSMAGIATAILIAFWKECFGVPGISFLWIIPSSLVVSVLVGILASGLTNALFGRTPCPSAQQR